MLVFVVNYNTRKLIHLIKVTAIKMKSCISYLTQVLFIASLQSLRTYDIEHISCWSDRLTVNSSSHGELTGISEVGTAHNHSIKNDCSEKHPLLHLHVVQRFKCGVFLKIDFSPRKVTKHVCVLFFKNLIHNHGTCRCTPEVSASLHFSNWIDILTLDGFFCFWFYCNCNYSLSKSLTNINKLCECESAPDWSEMEMWEGAATEEDAEVRWRLRFERERE